MRPNYSNRCRVPLAGLDRSARMKDLRQSVARTSVYVLMGFLVVSLILTASVRAEAPKELTQEQRKELENRASELNEQMDQLYQAGRYSAATELLKQVLAMRQRLYPPERYPQGHPVTAAEKT